MKGNWWKILVVVTLVAVVAVVVGNKGRDTDESRPVVAAKETATPASSPRHGTAIVVPDASDATAAAGAPESAQEPAQPKTGETCPTPKPEEPAPKPKANVPQKKTEPKPEPEADSAESKPAPKRLPKLLELGSTTCIPCKKMQPIIEEIKKEYRGKLQVEFINVSKNPGAAETYKIRLIPVQIFFDSKGKEVFRHVGFYPKKDIVAKLAKMGVK